jgi:hypothetical protein
MLVVIDRPVGTESVYIVTLIHPDHDPLSNEFGSIDEVEQTLTILLIEQPLLIRARNRFQNGLRRAELGIHTFTAADLEGHGFRRARE